MRQWAHGAFHSSTLSPWQQGIIGLVLQALLALTLVAGPRAINGPLHWHSGAGDHHAAAGMPGDVARHQHSGTVDVVMLEPGAATFDELSNGTAVQNAAAVLWPVQLTGLTLPHSEREPWAPPRESLAWSDADPWPLEHRPRG